MAAVTVYDACSERKQTSKILIIHDTATPSSSFVDDFSATFSDNIRSFLHDYSTKEDYTIDDGDDVVYSIFLASEATGVVFPLFVVEQHVSSSSSSNPLCDFCRCVGWSHHYVSKRKYHFIIPKIDQWRMPLTNLSSSSTHHLMHGVIHCNGYGHLLCINSSSSDLLSGYQIMEFWDLLCSTLRTRKISLEDVSRKRTMDLRLLHGVGYGRTWFGKWGYVFSHGSFGVDEEQYSRALHILGSMELDKVLEDFSCGKEESVVKMIIGFYRDSSETPLVTLSELFQFMIGFGSKSPIERKTAMSTVSNPILGDDNNTDFSSSLDDQASLDSDRDSCLDDDDGTRIMDMDMDIKLPVYDSFEAFAKGENSRWLGRRLSEAAQAVLKVFAERNSIITRQELRESVRTSIGDTGLIDFLLKHIDKVLIGDQVVQRFTDMKTRMLQFSLRSINPRALDHRGESDKRRKPKPKPEPQENDIEWTSTSPGLHPFQDVLYLYRNLLLNYPDSDIYSDASEIIFNCKSFVKEWPLPTFEEQRPLTVVSFQVRPNHEEYLRDFTRKLPPFEVVVVPRNATIRELKSVIEKSLRDTYCITETFEVLEVRNRDLVKLDESSGLNQQVKREFLVTGFGLDSCTELRYEGGFDDWIVHCKCGARDDDGERMVACDGCKVWQHTLCNSIRDDDIVPSVFLCKRCCGDSLRSKKRRNVAFR